MIVLLVLLSVAFSTEVLFTTAPLVYALLIAFFIRTKSLILFPLGFFFGILLDVLSLRVYGLTSMVFVVIFFLIHLYERKYEVTTVPFVFVSSFFGAMLLLSLYGYSNIFPQSIAVAVVGVVFFFTASKAKAHQ